MAKRKSPYKLQPMFATAVNVSFERSEPKVGRNDFCPCGSNLKYKKCCLRSDEQKAIDAREAVQKQLEEDARIRKESLEKQKELAKQKLAERENKDAESDCEQKQCEVADRSDDDSSTGALPSVSSVSEKNE